MFVNPFLDIFFDYMLFIVFKIGKSSFTFRQGAGNVFSRRKSDLSL